MKINVIAGLFSLAVSTIVGVAPVRAEPATVTDAEVARVQIQHIRNATAKVTYGDTTFLVDPMLAGKGAYPGFEGTYRSELRNPLIDLPMPASEVMAHVDAVIVTHTHLDHWDDVAQAKLPKAIPLFVQNAADAALVRSQGFKDVRVLGENSEFNGITLSKTGGQHGTDAMYAVAPLAKVLGEAMGFVLRAKNYKTVYFVGDTIWRDEVQDAFSRYRPDVVVLNTGDARVNGFEDSIIMGKQDTLRALEHAPQATVVAVHMDTVNHAALSRKELRKFVAEKSLQKRVLVPADGRVMKF
ncbi:MBL fold metallo-hydrolase [uncultured Microbulbifer sp.]|uniref:MBL fold metallo-hydrolase n=1 Tax=uncultured Microbulbifer sp. TaxID=348147 RepID=UPI0025E84689|nr:MBL fold metallo-hydrolase [uncultured Microbulbifer sp.]